MVSGTSYAVRAQARRRLLLLAQGQFDASAFRAHSAAPSSSNSQQGVLQVPVTIHMASAIVPPPATRPFELMSTCVERIRDRFTASIMRLPPVAREALRDCLDSSSFPFLCFDIFWCFLLRDYGLPALERRAANPPSAASSGMHHYAPFLAISEDEARSLLTNVFIAMASDGRPLVSIDDLSALSSKIDMDLPADSWQLILEEVDLGTNNHTAISLDEFLVLMSFQFLEDVRIREIKHALSIIHQRSSVLFISIVSPVRFSLHTRDLITNIFAHSVAHVVTVFLQRACDECLWNRLLASSLEARVSEWFSGVGSMSADTKKAEAVKLGAAPDAALQPPHKLFGTLATAVMAMRGRVGLVRPPTAPSAGAASSSAAADIRQQLLALRSPRAAVQPPSEAGAPAAVASSPLKPTAPASSPRSVVGTFLTEVRRPMSASLRKGSLDLRARTEAFQAVLVTSRSKHVLHTTEARGVNSLTVRPSAAAADILARGREARGPQHEYKTKQMGNVPLILTATAERTIAKHARRLQQRFNEEEETLAKEAHRISSSLLAKYDEVMLSYEQAKKSPSGMNLLSHQRLSEQQRAIDAVLGSPLVVHVSDTGRAMLVSASTNLAILAKQLMRQERFAIAHGELQ
jgi:hypothetical protein